MVSLQRTAGCLLAFIAAGYGSSVRGTEFSWVPVDADSAFTLAGSDEAGEPTEIILDEGSATIVEFELRMNGWSDANATLGTAQAGVDAQGFLGSNAVPANPGVDLTPLFNQAWREATGGFGLNDGAFIVTDTCHDFTLANTGIPCKSEPAKAWASCLSASPICIGRDDWVFNGNVASKAVSTATPNFVWGGVTNAGDCTVDERDSRCIGDGDPFACCTGAGTGTCQGSFYLGTLVLNIPTGARGTYTFGFDPRIGQTFMNDCAGGALSGLVRTPGKITVRGATGKCCYNTRIDPQCIDSVTELDCSVEPAPRFFTLGATCSGAVDECALDCGGLPEVGGVALSDLTIFRFCFKGPQVPLGPGCEVFDFDCDGDIDLRDFSGFQHAFAP